jgi:hypothetical protein
MRNAQRFFAKTMARLEPSISSAKDLGCHRPFPGIRIIFCGDLAIGMAKSFLVLDMDDDDERQLFGSVEDLGQVISSPWAMPLERRRHIYLCRDLNMSLRELWPRVKKWL